MIWVSFMPWQAIPKKCLDFLHPWPGTALHFVMKARKDDLNHPYYTQAMSGPIKEQFLKAISNEIKALEKHGTWKL